MSKEKVEVQVIPNSLAVHMPKRVCMSLGISLMNTLQTLVRKGRWPQKDRTQNLRRKTEGAEKCSLNTAGGRVESGDRSVRKRPQGGARSPCAAAFAPGLGLRGPGSARGSQPCQPVPSVLRSVPNRSQPVGAQGRVGPNRAGLASIAVLTSASISERRN